MDLTKKKCEACEGGVERLSGNDLKDFKKQIEAGWHIVKELELEHEYKFADFKEALDFVNKVGAIAEDEGHHPDVVLGWGKVKITLTTHAINGLSINDFILAAKIDKIEKK